MTDSTLPPGATPVTQAQIDEAQGRSPLRYQDHEGNFERPARIVERGFNGTDLIVAVMSGSKENLVVMTSDGRLRPDGPVQLLGLEA